MRNKIIYILSVIFMTLALLVVFIDVLAQGENGLFDTGVCDNSLKRTARYEKLDYDSQLTSIGYQCRAAIKKYPNLENWDMYATIGYLIVCITCLMILNLYPIIKKSLRQRMLRLSKINFLLSIGLLLFLFFLYPFIYESIFGWIISKV